MKRSAIGVLFLTFAFVAVPVRAQFFGNEFNNNLSQVSAWKGIIPTDPAVFPYALPFRIYERDQPVVAFEWLAGPLTPEPGINRTYSLGNRTLTEDNAASQGVDWQLLENIFRQPDDYRFFSPTAEPGLLNERDYFITLGPGNPGNAAFDRFIPQSLDGLFLNVHGETRNDPDQSRWVFWARADGAFVPEPSAFWLAGIACCYCLARPWTATDKRSSPPARLGRVSGQSMAEAHTRRRPLREYVAFLYAHATESGAARDRDA
jgi:hypothetical protein